MIMFQRTASIAPGKIGEALSFAHEICALIKKTHGVDLGVFLPVGGNPMRINWIGEYENLDAVDKIGLGLMADEEYNKLLLKGTDLFIPGSIEDAMWRKI